MNAVIQINLDGATRQHLEDVIEKLVSLLDAFDGDENLEDGFDAEPSIGTACFVNGRLEYDVEQDMADDEPDLGWSAPRCGDPDYALGWQALDSSVDHTAAGWSGDGQQIAQNLIRRHLADPARRESALRLSRL